MNDIREIASHFLPDGELTVRPLGEGIINTTYAAELSGKKYVLQMVNTHVFPDPDAVMENTVRVTEWMRKRLTEEGKDPSRRVLEFLPCDLGGYLFRTGDGEVWRCSKFIEGAEAHTVLNDPKLLLEAGRGYGEFQRLNRDFPAEVLHEVLPGFHNTANRYQAFLDAIEADAVGRVKEVSQEIEFFKSHSELATAITSRLESGELPLRVTHNDTKLSNVLLDNETGEAVAVIDLDTVMPGSVLYDFGDAIRTGAASASEDEPNLDKMKFLPEYYEAFKQGFLEGCGDILEPAEKDNLLLGAKVITYEQGLRFLTDYLNGDTYYKTVFPGHNLVRTRTQIKMLSGMPEA